jgi:hypothetical protein
MLLISKFSNTNATNIIYKPKYLSYRCRLFKGCSDTFLFFMETVNYIYKIEQFSQLKNRVKIYDMIFFNQFVKYCRRKKKH